jgi:hypothetical protein
VGRTPKPLRILAHPDLANSPELLKLAEMGHLVVEGLTPCTSPGSSEGSASPVTGGSEPSPPGTTDSLWSYDLILGPNCWRMSPSLMKHLDLSIKSARAIRYPGRVVAKRS